MGRVAWAAAYIATLFAVVFAPGSWGQDSGEIAELKALLLETQASMTAMQSAYEARIDALEQRLNELEGNAEETEERQAELEVTAIEQQTLLEEVRSEARDRLSLHGYYDFQYINADNEVIGSFIQNELSIFLRSTTEDERWTIFGELEFERVDGNDYVRGFEGESEDHEIETAWLEYRHADWLRVRGGKLLLPQYWQTYHYPNLTLSTLPPLMVGNVFPKSIVAVQLSGDWWSPNGWGVSYALYGGNGGEGDRRELDENENKAVGSRLTLRLAGKNRPEWLDTLDVSVSGYLGDDEYGRGESILGVDTQIRVGRAELQAEFAQGNQSRYTRRFLPWLRDDAGDALGFYVQPAYQLAPQWHLFYRFDYLDLDDKRWTAFDEQRHTLGVNYRPRPNISLKLEFFHGEPEDHGEDFNGLASSVVFNF